MKKYLALLLLALITTLSFGQSNYQDVVYLKNGSIIRGVIIEQIPNKSIKIKTADSSVIVYQMDEIEKSTKETIQIKLDDLQSNSGLQSGHSHKGILEWGYHFGTGSYGMDRLKLNIINAYQINPYFSFGFGTGLRYYFDNEAALLPFFVDLRANFINSEISPYFSFGIGYSFDLTNDFKGVGFLLNPTLGISFKVSDKSAINVGLGCELQNMKFYRYGSTHNKNSGAISINVGISF